MPSLSTSPLAVTHRRVHASNQPVYIVDACRSPLGKVGGMLAAVRPDDLAAQMLTALLGRTPALDPASVDDVIWGAANQAGEDNRDVARMAALLAGLPDSVPGLTVNRLCASGMSAVVDGARAIATGEADLVIAGGGESMTRAPFVTGGPGRGLGDELADTRLGWRLVNPALHEAYPVITLGETAEIVAERFHVSRNRQDAFALASHTKAQQAWDDNAFVDEVVTISEGQLLRDEGIRVDTSVAALSVLPPVFRRDGSVTAGNSSQLSDGAAVLLLASSQAAESLGSQPLARYVASAAAGVHPHTMGMGPVPATRKVLARAGWSIDQIERVELNEAFASQALAVIDELELPPDRVNQQGGAIAFGHPLGCSGARLIGTLAHQLAASGDDRGLATMCVGVGQGQSVLIERA